MRYGWEILVPFRYGHKFGCAVPPSESVSLTIDALRKDDPVWRQKPRIRPLREPVETYDKHRVPGRLRIRYYTREDESVFY